MAQKYPLNREKRLMLCGDPQGAEPVWLPLAAGIKSRTTKITETVRRFYEVSREDAPAEEPLGQEVHLLFLGHRCDDPAQELAFSGGSFGQEVNFLDWDASVRKGPNARRGRGILTAQELGGDADGRQEVQFTLRISGGTQPGTVTERDGGITFHPKEG